MSGIYRGPNSSVAAQFVNADGDKGDIVVSSSGASWTIDAEVVDSSKVSTIIASKISNIPAGNLTSSNVQDSLVELQLELDTKLAGSGLSDHIDDAIDAHNASAISNIPAGNLTATDIQGALYELQTDIDSLDPSNYLQLAGGSLTGLLNVNDGADIASASTVDLTAATGNTVRITGTTPITAFTMNAGQQMELVAVGALPLTYHSTTMNINGGASYTCAAGDRLFVNKANDGVIMVNVIKQDGTAVASVFATQSDYNTGTDTTKALNSAILRANNLGLGTPIATTSGTSHILGSIPSWAKRVTLLINAVSLSGTDNLLIRLGDAGGIENTGYDSVTINTSTTVTTTFTTAAIQLNIALAARDSTGSLTFTKLSSSLDTWIFSGTAHDGVANGNIVSGVKTLSAPLTQIEVLATGANTFDAGSINILWE